MMLPPAITAALEARLEGQERAGLAAAADRFSLAYRAGLPSAGVIATDIDALAYALVRMPATFAAVRFALTHAKQLLPDFAPVSLWDIGAGTGAASLAAQAVWPSCVAARHVEPNAPLARVAAVLAASTGLEVAHVTADARVFRPSEQADMALAAYLLVEVEVAEADAIVRHMMGGAAELVALVEPGTPRGFARIRAARDVVAQAGWHILAPCPQPGACPLLGNDWCHFHVRLARSRAHKLIKRADVPFEDEPLSYLIATRQPSVPAPSRVLRAPVVEKGQVRLCLCTRDGVADTAVPRRDKARYKAAKSLDAGDVWDGNTA